MYEANDSAKATCSNGGAKMVYEIQEIKVNHNPAMQSGSFYGLGRISVLVSPWMPCRPTFAPLLSPNTSPSNLSHAIRYLEACNHLPFSAHSMGTCAPVVQEWGRIELIPDMLTVLCESEDQAADMPKKNAGFLFRLSREAQNSLLL